MTICMRYVSQTGQRATPTARITCVARHLYPTRPRFRVHSTVAPRECGIGQLQPILRENLESPVLRYQPITTAVVTDACLNTRWHHGAYTSAVLRESLGMDRVVTVYAELSRPDWLATVQSGRKQVQSRALSNAHFSFN